MLDYYLYSIMYSILLFGISLLILRADIMSSRIFPVFNISNPVALRQKLTMIITIIIILPFINLLFSLFYFGIAIVVRLKKLNLIKFDFYSWLSSKDEDGKTLQDYLDERYNKD
jgi:hypothetical protein